MSVTFTKLFSSITESTIWCEPANTRLVWITMLAMADRGGRVWASIPGLANRARVPLEDCEKAITTFLSPDRYSRTPDFEGRRIEPIDGGWRLLNHAKYRAIRDEESVKESKRRYINERRARERADVDSVRQSSTPSTVERGRDNAESDADAENASTPLPPPQAAARPARFNALDMDLPDWIPREAWASWCAHRAAKRQRLTEISVKQQVKFLTDQYMRGVPPAAIIEQSVRNGWTGLFELKGVSGGTDRQHRESASERTERKAAEFLGMARATGTRAQGIGRETGHLALGQDEPDLRPPLDEFVQR